MEHRYIVTMVVDTTNNVDKVINWLYEAINAQSELSQHCNDWWVEEE